MITNQFETIPAFTTLAGDSLGSHTQRQIACDLLIALQTASDYDTRQLWQDIATLTDDDEYFIETQSDIAQAIQDNCPIADYCTIELFNNEWSVTPYIDDDLPRFDFTPDVSHPVSRDSVVAYDLLVVNDHGNTSLMHWNDQKREYIETWAMV